MRVFCLSDSVSRVSSLPGVTTCGDVIMSTRTNRARLLSPEEITRREKQAKRLLRQKFRDTSALKLWHGHLDVGLARLTEKGAMARTIARHMKRRGITTVAELADKLYLNPESDTLSWMCLPNAFRHAKSNMQNLRYLLVLCNLEWDKEERTYTFISTERPT